MSKQYETVLVVDAMIPDESIASEFDAVTKLIESQGKIVRVDQAGHWLHHDQLELFLRETRQFLAE